MRKAEQISPYHGETRIEASSKELANIRSRDYDPQTRLVKPANLDASYFASDVDCNEKTNKRQMFS